MSYKQREEFKSGKLNAPTKRLRSFKDVTRHLEAKRDKSKRKIKRRDLDRQNSTNPQSVSADAHQNADPGLRSDDFLLQPVQSITVFPLPD